MLFMSCVRHLNDLSTLTDGSFSFQVICRNLNHAIRKKRPEMEIEKMYFHQDNAPAHRCEETLLTIDFLGFQRLRHAPYSPDCAPMDFAVFPRLKLELRGKRFADLEELRVGVRSAISGFDREWYKGEYQQWVSRHQKCVKSCGRYFEE
jgi:histone-lysine N-methyltransferase SETMAR